MSTRANVLIKDEFTTLYFYRHSDGYLKATGESLKEFVKGYGKGMRLDAMQSAGWLIIHGAAEYNDGGVRALPNPKDGFGGWKVGAYEPTGSLHSDVEYIYIVDLEAKTLTCRTPFDGFWDKPCLENTKPLPGFKTAIQGGAQ